MTDDASLVELLVGIEGLALMRRVDAGDPAGQAAKLARVARLLADPAAREPIGREHDARAGYAEWSASYDGPGNPIVAREQAVVWPLIEAAAPGRALDAACGTGRHTERLVAAGHDVSALDLTPEMLAIARRRAPGAAFAQGDLRALPHPDRAFDLVVCGLALGHLADPAPAVAELARVTAAGGRLVISLLHPLLVVLGWQARFTDRRGERAWVREHPHRMSALLAALRAGGLTLETCHEPSLTREDVGHVGRWVEHLGEDAITAFAGLPAVLVLEAHRP